MSTTPNAYGAFLSNTTPFLSNYAAIAAPWGTFVRPGGRIAAYVRSTGAQDGEDHFASSGLLVASINEGLKRCRSGQNDIVVCLPGHAETYSSGTAWANLVAGAQIVSMGAVGSTNNPTLTLSGTTSSLALNVANVVLAGFTIVASAAVTGGIVVTAAGCTLASNLIQSSTALGANSIIQVTSAPTFGMFGNNLSIDSTATMVAITGATSTDFLIVGNIARQKQSTSGGSFSTTANTAGISGHYANNFYKTATTSTGGAGVIVLGAATITTVGNHENYGGEETAAQSLIVTGA